MDGARPAASAEDLAREAQGGSVHAFEALVARFEGPLFNFLFMRTGNAAAAEDLCQEAFLRAWQRLVRYDARWRFSTWLYTLAQNLAVSAHRSRSREPRPEGEARLREVPVIADPIDAAAGRDEGRALWDLAARVLREEERSALWLRYAEDLSVEEIARVVGRPRVTVRVWLFRARERLGKALQETRSARSAPPTAPSGTVPIERRRSAESVGGLP